MPYFKIPDGAKPSKVASKDETRPILTQGNIRQRGEDWTLEVTDSYCLSIIPLTVHEGGDTMIREGQVSRDVLLAIEKHRMSGFGFNADGTVSVYGRASARVADKLLQVTFIMPNTAERDGEPVSVFPNVDQLVNACPAKTANGSLLRIGLNPQLLSAIASAQGRSRDGAVVLEVDPNAATNGQYLCAVLVTVNGSENLLMPMRTN